MAGGASKVGQDQPGEGRQAAKAAGDGGLVPYQVNREGWARHEEKIGSSIPEDLVREINVAIAHIQRLGHAPMA